MRTGREYPKGDFVDKDGNVLGRHKGIINYTVGQRKGLGIALGQPAYVIKVDPLSNTVTLGGPEDLMSYELDADDVNLISVPDLSSPMNVTAKVRYRNKGVPAVAVTDSSGILHIKFEEPQKSVTKGQAVVMYDGDEVVGGGTIL